MEKYCQACGMPLIRKEDFSLGDENSDFCVYCTNPDGSVKPVEEIFEGGIGFFMSTVNADRGLAERVTRKNMNSLVYWQGKNLPILQGEQASDAEFAAALEKL